MRLGEQLVARGALEDGQVRVALAEQERAGGRLGDILLARGAVDSASLCVALAEQSSLPSLVPEYEAVPVLPRAVAYAHRAAVLAGPSGPSTAPAAALVALEDLASVPALSAVLGRPVQPRLADARTLDALLAEGYAHADAEATVAALARWRWRRRARAAATGLLLGALGAAAVGGALLEPWWALAGAVGASSALWLAAAVRAARTRRPGAPLELRRPDDAPATGTIVIPVSGESPQRLYALGRELEALDYPRHRLQGLAVLDPADRAARRWLRSHPLPGWVAVLVAPQEVARTRAGLALYGLRQARGEAVTLVGRHDALDPAAARSAAALRDAQGPHPSTGRAARRLAARWRRAAQPSPLAAALAAVTGRRPAASFVCDDARQAFGWGTREGRA